jgi:hypothetical protein
MKTVEPVVVKVTRLKAVGYGIIITILGREWCRRTVESRQEVGPAIKSDLRMIDKCGVRSPMADASRHRGYRKQQLAR